VGPACRLTDHFEVCCMFQLENSRIAIIGLGYVGLPLAVEFGKKFPTVGLDINSHRIDELRRGRDSTLEVSEEELASAGKLRYTSTPAEIADANIYIVTVPTPVDKNNRPDFEPLISASRAVGPLLKRNDIVIYESTVYPGATEEVCIPVLEQTSGLKFNRDFFAGYSPERVNPGDKQHRVANIRKVTSGSTPEVTDFVDALYRTIITAGTHKVSNMRAAEAAKVIENTQRDVNIALINELALIFNRLGIDTQEVLEAAGSKWNFLPFRPGLVGGHCIGVDPYYLTFKAEEIGYHPEIILAGRRINDGMGAYVAQRVIKLMAQRHIAIADSKVLVLGITFKENCTDIRNTRVVDIVNELASYNAKVDIFDPWAKPEDVKAEYGVSLVTAPAAGQYDAVIVAVAHDQFRELGVTGIRRFGKPQSVLFDVKSVLPRDQIDGRL
jgi:UDP-N-acetyl-D-galactosamine dehydrogenase